MALWNSNFLVCLRIRDKDLFPIFRKAIRNLMVGALKKRKTKCNWLPYNSWKNSCWCIKRYLTHVGTGTCITPRKLWSDMQTCFHKIIITISIWTCSALVWSILLPLTHRHVNWNFFSAFKCDTWAHNLAAHFTNVMPIPAVQQRL